MRYRAMRRRARVISFAMRPDYRPNWARQMLIGSKARRNERQVVLTDQYVRNTGHVLV
jgi:hypothetical protein